MNQIKIGKFIAQKRKEKNLTQSELAEKLNVTDRSVSNWENGKCMPDISLFNPLCSVLDITINEFLSGEEIENKDYQKKLEENIINTINYNNKKNLLPVILLIFGITLTIFSLTMFNPDSSLSGVYTIIGLVIAITGFNMMKSFSKNKRIIMNIGISFISLIAILGIDYIESVNLKQAPRFYLEKEINNNMIVYHKLFSNIYRININTINEYYVFDNNKKYTTETAPNVPFNREKSGIDSIIKYQNKYLGNNSNTINLIGSLPLSEYGNVIELDSTNLGIIIDYHVTDWYINNDNYVEKSLIYNTFSIFSLIENVNYITYNFTGNTYTITREKFEEVYPSYKTITYKNFTKEKFITCLEEKINNYTFINDVFDKLFT